jgi:hypothetical protein
MYISFKGHDRGCVKKWGHCAYFDPKCQGQVGVFLLLY